MLYGIAEGVVALDPQRRVTLVNDGRPPTARPARDCVGTSLPELAIEGRLRDVLAGSTTVTDARDAVVVRRGRVLVMNRMAVLKDGRSTRLGDHAARPHRAGSSSSGSSASFRSTRPTLLRAQAHEFANQLHTISGLIQIGEYDEVVTYVRALQPAPRVARPDRRPAASATPPVAALLMAKSAVAAERRVELAGRSDAPRCDRLDPRARPPTSPR